MLSTPSLYNIIAAPYLPLRLVRSLCRSFDQPSNLFALHTMTCDLFAVKMQDRNICSARFDIQHDPFGRTEESISVTYRTDKHDAIAARLAGYRHECYINSSRSAVPEQGVEIHQEGGLAYTLNSRPTSFATLSSSALTTSQS